jgi:hypothetical protein
MKFRITSKDLAKIIVDDETLKEVLEKFSPNTEILNCEVECKQFVAHVDLGGGGGRKLKVFSVPCDILNFEQFKQGRISSFRSEQDAAGWYYMNAVDFYSTIGPYEYCILPLESYEELFVYKAEKEEFIAANNWRLIWERRKTKII